MTDGILEGITRAALLEIARNEGLEVEARPIDRTELYVADEAFLCGTGAQVAPVTKVDHRLVGNGTIGPITSKLHQAYEAVVTGKDVRYSHWLTPVYER